MDSRIECARHWIGGRWVPSTDRGEAESIDPATGAPVGRFADGGAADAASAIAAARDAFERTDWARSPRLRQDVLLEWAARLELRQAELAHLLTLENGKVLRQAEGEVAAAISEIRYYAGHARALRGSAQEVEPGVFSTIYREAAGVASIIVPWNGPVLLLIRSMAPALAAGCTCVVKPAPQTALVTVAVLEQLAALRALPAGTVNLVLEKGHSAAELLVTDPQVDVVSFTGSTMTGQKIMAAAAPTMKKLSLELGGKACCLVFEDADIAKIAPMIADAATILSGQQCTAARRVLVHASRAVEMKRLLRNALADIKVGTGTDRASQMGPLVDIAARDGVERRMQEAFDRCDEVLLRCRRPERAPKGSAFLTPALIAHRDPDAFFCQEEIFGPLVVLETFETEEEAVARANHSVFGLAASVWTDDGARALRVASALRDGTVWINDHNRLFAEAEMGGYRRSGLGRLHGHDALADFTEQKHIYQSAGTLSRQRLADMTLSFAAASCAPAAGQAGALRE
ncbi:MAG TPA: aldehyde dehydrogenase family protein [Rhizobiaceae bacterium]|nr:aldehyde dehydrogenase family protein [Rhizobiaceae bacterium]